MCFNKVTRFLFLFYFYIRIESINEHSKQIIIFYMFLNRNQAIYQNYYRGKYKNYN